MSRIMTRGAILATSRLSNFAIVMISPIVLVRILTIEDYGRYQEFMLYAMLVVALSDLSIDTSLTYFLPKYPERERAIVSQTSAVVLTFSLLCILTLLLAQSLFLKITTYDFVAPLAVYVFCFANLNWLEFYWLAKRRTDLVMFYTAGRLLLRLGVLLIVAFVTRDVESILWAVVGAEALRLAFVAVYLHRRRMFTTDWRFTDVKEQIGYSGPIGIAGLVQSAGRSIGKLVIGSILGPAAFAYYTIASYLVPLVRLLRGSITDVVFPELVRSRHDPEAKRRLWQRTNVLYCVLLFPSFTLLTFYGELVITTLFTKNYLAALPVFQVYMIFLLRRCFNFDVLLRSEGRTAFVLTGSVLALVTNIILIVVLNRHFGFIGPAMAFIASEIVLEIYYAMRTSRALQLDHATLVDWRGVRSVAVGCLVGLPLLIIAKFIHGPELLRAVVASIAFVSACWFVAFRLGVDDIGKLVTFALSSIRRRSPS